MTGYFRPATLDEALAIRAEHDVAVIAGGTDIYPAHAARRAWGEPTHKDVLDITAIPGLDRIEETEDGWRIGCLVTWSALRVTPLPPLFDGLKRASREIGGPQVQNRGTIVGNLITASPAGDGIPNLMVLEARVEIAGPSGRRQAALREFLTGYRSTGLRADELVTGLVVPRLDGARGGFRKLGARRYLVISITMAAGVVVCDDGRIAEARIAIGACSAVAQRLRVLELALRGVPLAAAPGVVAPEHFERLRPITDVRASANYRQRVSEQAVRDLLRGLA